MSTTMTWKDVCAYWDGECNKLMNLNEQVNDFLFDLFRKMLLHQGFINEGIPFYLGYVSGKYKPRSQEIICLIFIFNHLGNCWMKMLGFAILDEK